MVFAITDAISQECRDVQDRSSGLEFLYHDVGRFLRHLADELRIVGVQIFFQRIDGICRPRSEADGPPMDWLMDLTGQSKFDGLRFFAADRARESRRWISNLSQGLKLRQYKNVAEAFLMLS